MAKERLPEPQVPPVVIVPPALPPVEKKLPVVVADEPDEPTRTNASPPPEPPKAPKTDAEEAGVSEKAMQTGSLGGIIASLGLFIAIMATLIAVANLTETSRATAPPKPPAVTVAKTVTHVVKRGENMMVLAEKYGVTQRMMIESNLDLIRENTASCDRRGSTSGLCERTLFEGELLTINRLLPGQTAVIPVRDFAQ